MPLKNYRQCAMGQSAKMGKDIEVYLVDEPQYFDRDGLYGENGGDYENASNQISQIAHNYTLAKLIDEKLAIPTIGCGAGPDTTAQNLNAYDILGIFDKFMPKFVKQYAQMGNQMVEAFNIWAKEIDSGEYPKAEHSFTMKDTDLPPERT